MQVKSHEKRMLNKIMFWKTVFTLFFLKAKKPSLTTACKELWLTISEERNGNSIGYSAAICNHMKQTNWTNKNMICKTAFTKSILIDKAALFIAKCSVLTNSLQYLQQIWGLKMLSCGLCSVFISWDKSFWINKIKVSSRVCVFVYWSKSLYS